MKGNGQRSLADDSDKTTAASSRTAHPGLLFFFLGSRPIYNRLVPKRKNKGMGSRNVRMKVSPELQN